MGAVAARCGQLPVPEDPGAPTGKQITLHVAVVPALNRRAASDPLFVLAGGPGQAASDFYAGYAAAFAPISRDRDIVLVDQRGTGRSAALNCSYPDDPEVADLDPEQLRAATRACLAELTGDPRFYTTSVAVRDLEAVRLALGLNRINLYGVSYGTRVAQHYLRRYSHAVRTLILDGAVPPEVVLGPDMAPDAQAALDAMFERCAKDAACDARFPDLKQTFSALLGRLSNPVTLSFPHPTTGNPTELKFGATHLVGIVRLLTYSDSTAALLPLLIHNAAAGQFAPLAAQYLLLEQSLDAQFAYGMHNAVACTEDVPLLDPARIDRTALGATYLGATSLEGLSAICSVWPAGVMDADLHAPLPAEVGANVPVLILSGGNDPITPRRYGEQTLAQFPRGRHIVVADHGHGQLGSPCVPGLLARFVDAASADIAAECVDSVRAAPFLLNFSGPAP